MKKFVIDFLEDEGEDGFVEKKLYIKLDDNAKEEDVLHELIRIGYQGKVIKITEEK